MPRVLLLMCALLLVATGAHASNVRFVALGDLGTGDEPAKRVADAAREVCEARGGCDFGLLLGDNVYPRGIAAADDPLFEKNLGEALERVGVPFYAVLGNHDYGAPKELPFLGGAGFDPRRAAAQIERGQGNGVFRMPDHFWRLERGPLEIVAFDTNALYWADRPGVEKMLGLDEVRRRMTRAMKIWDETSTKPWRIAIAHHPLRSNGPHGDAGAFGGPLGILSSGRELSRFLDERVMGRFDAYLTGHDHSLQDLGDEQGTELFISGAAAEATTLGTRHAARWQAAERGFLLVEGDETRLSFSFVTVDEAGVPRVAHTREISRPHPIADRIADRDTPRRANSASDREALPSR